MNQKFIKHNAETLADKLFNDFGKEVLESNRDWSQEYIDDRYTTTQQVAEMETLALKLFCEKVKTIYPVQITFDVE